MTPFKRDDMVVVNGHIGNLVEMNDNGCQLGLSFLLEELPHDCNYEICNGHRCSNEGMRHATEQEIEMFKERENDVCDMCERADDERKMRFFYPYNTAL